METENEFGGALSYRRGGTEHNFGFGGIVAERSPSMKAERSDICGSAEA